MTARLLRGGAALAAALVLTACGPTAAQPPRPPERPGVDHPLDGVTSVCDKYGHRVYRYEGYKEGGLDVVEADPTCQKAGR